MVRAGFKNIYVGFESSTRTWQQKTGGKVYSSELQDAVEAWRAAGASLKNIKAYLIAGHPKAEDQETDSALDFARSVGIGAMLAEFSPLPGTPDGEEGRKWVDLDEPLNHNKTAFAIRRLGEAEINRLKQRCKEINQTIK